VKDTRTQGDAVAESHEDGFPDEEIADNFDIAEDVAREQFISPKEGTSFLLPRILPGTAKPSRPVFSRIA